MNALYVTATESDSDDLDLSNFSSDEEVILAIEEPLMSPEPANNQPNKPFFGYTMPPPSVQVIPKNVQNRYQEPDKSVQNKVQTPKPVQPPKTPHIPAVKSTEPKKEPLNNRQLTSPVYGYTMPPPSTQLPPKNANNLQKPQIQNNTSNLLSSKNLSQSRRNIPQRTPSIKRKNMNNQPNRNYITDVKTPKNPRKIQLSSALVKCCKSKTGLPQLIALLPNTPELEPSQMLV